MSNVSIDMNSARAILSTYRDVHDTPNANHITQTLRSKLNQKNKHLESELYTLKEKYLLLQHELLNKEKKLQVLNSQLVEKTTYMSQLQDDFDNAIQQLGFSKR